MSKQEAPQPQEPRYGQIEFKASSGWNGTLNVPENWAGLRDTFFGTDAEGSFWRMFIPGWARIGIASLFEGSAKGEAVGDWLSVAAVANLVALVGRGIKLAREGSEEQKLEDKKREREEKHRFSQEVKALTEFLEPVAQHLAKQSARHKPRTTEDAKLYKGEPLTNRRVFEANLHFLPKPWTKNTDLVYLELKKDAPKREITLKRLENDEPHWDTEIVRFGYLRKQGALKLAGYTYDTNGIEGLNYLAFVNQLLSDPAVGAAPGRLSKT